MRLRATIGMVVAEPPDQPDPSPGKPPDNRLDYEPWPQRRKTPKPVKILIWAAILIHSVGILPAAVFLWFAMTDESSRLADVLGSGACCVPFGLLLVLSVIVVLYRVGEKS